MRTLKHFGVSLMAAFLFTIAFSTFQAVSAQSKSKRVAAPLVTAGQVLITEFRFHGNAGTTSGAGSSDEFVEIYNNTDSAITVNDLTPPTSPAPAGWAVVGANNAATPSISARFVIPNGTVIPARGHFLGVNTNGATSYSLGSYAAGDIVADPVSGTTSGGYSTGIVDGGSVAVFRTANSTLFNDANRLDAVGFAAPASNGSATYIEGTGLTPAGGIATRGEYSFVRKMSSTTGLPQDTDNNQADFVFVSTTGGTFSTRVSALGAPGPENLTSPVLKTNAQVIPSLIDPGMCSCAGQNRVRDTRAASFPSGTLSIQRRFTNNTTSALTKLRFRVVDITTLNNPSTAPATQADLRVLTSNGQVFDSAGMLVATVTGTTIETPPTQTTNGGGLNTSLSVTFPGTTLDVGSFIDVQFLLGVAGGGNFRFFIIVEALP
jgi:hypothetical protein